MWCLGFSQGLGLIPPFSTDVMLSWRCKIFTERLVFQLGALTRHGNHCNRLTFHWWVTFPALCNWPLDVHSLTIASPQWLQLVSSHITEACYQTPWLMAVQRSWYTNQMWEPLVFARCGRSALLCSALVRRFKVVSRDWLHWGGSFFHSTSLAKSNKSKEREKERDAGLEGVWRGKGAWIPTNARLNAPNDI